MKLVFQIYYTQPCFLWNVNVQKATVWSEKKLRNRTDTNTYMQWFFSYILPGKGLREFKKCHIFVYKWQFTIIGYIDVQLGRGHYEVAFQFWSTFFKDCLETKQIFLQNFNLSIVLFYCSRRDYRTSGEFYIDSCMSNSASNFRACAYFVWFCASFSKPMILWESYCFLLLIY